MVPQLPAIVALSAMPPMADQLLNQSIETMRAKMAELLTSPTSEVAYQRMVNMHESSLHIFENMAALIKNIEKALAESESTKHPTHRRPLSESRCVNGLKTLGSDKSEFKNWNEKLINALSQSLGSPWRAFMRNLNRQLDKDRRVLLNNELNEIEGAELIREHDNCVDDIMSSLKRQRAMQPCG